MAKCLNHPQAAAAPSQPAEPTPVPPLTGICPGSQPNRHTLETVKRHLKPNPVNLASDAWQGGRVDVDDIAEVVRRLERAQVNLEPGLSAQELSAIEARFGISFNPAHRALLAAALPIGEGWMDWRHGVVDVLRGRLEWPIDGIVFDVHQSGFWPRSWGPRPTAPADAERVARQYLERVPLLIPIYSHRCTPAAPAPGDSPVFSAYQSDVIVYGDNLLDYVAREFGVGPPAPTPEDQQLRIPFWSSLAAGADNDDL